MRINKQGRTLKITLEMLAQDSCRISRLFGDPKMLRAYLDGGQLTKLRRRLEADAKSLLAVYQFGRLHRGLRLTWGFLDEWLRVPWVHMDERCLRHTLREASETGRRLDVVAGGAPGWEDRWSRARICTARSDSRGGYGFELVDEEGRLIEPAGLPVGRLSGLGSLGSRPQGARPVHQPSMRPPLRNAAASHLGACYNFCSNIRYTAS